MALINREELLKTLDGYEVTKWYHGDLMTIIFDAPTVEAELVVYCKGCVYSRPLTKDERHRFNEYPIYCLHSGLGVLDHDYCSYGERKDGD